jgi:hypothetical protein
MFKCLSCGETFIDPEIYEETHGLDCGPYERVAVCPNCASTNFSEWEPNVEKIEVAQVLVNVAAALNRLQNSIADVFGASFKNEDLEHARDISIEFVEEIYDEFMPLAVSNAMRIATSTNDVNKILLNLEG